ncbi:hypothetical protein NL676_025722 [Syzygium grande]|nr:hypothetical protein NL676_025722 [Syzygium grande]
MERKKFNGSGGAPRARAHRDQHRLVPRAKKQGKNFPKKTRHVSPTPLEDSSGFATGPRPHREPSRRRTDEMERDPTHGPPPPRGASAAGPAGLGRAGPMGEAAA